MNSQRNFPIVCLAGLFTLVCLLPGDVDAKCYECDSTCLTTKDGKSNEKVDDLNKKNCLPCGEMPDAEHPVALSEKDQRKPKTCDSTFCYTALALVRKKTVDGLMLTTNFTERGCIDVCPRPICDLTNLYTCGFNQQMSSGLQGRITGVISEIQRQFKMVHSETTWKDMGMGSELHCCSGDLCNHHSETEFAHKNIREDL